MTTGATATGIRAAGSLPAAADRPVRVGFALLLGLCAAVSVGWLGLGAVVAAAQYSASLGRAAAEAGAAGNSWARAVAEAAPSSEPFSQAVLDFGFSALNLALAVVLLAAGVSTWSVRLLALALVGSAGATVLAWLPDRLEPLVESGTAA